MRRKAQATVSLSHTLIAADGQDPVRRLFFEKRPVMPGGITGTVYFLLRDPELLLSEYWRISLILLSESDMNLLSLSSKLDALSRGADC